MEPSKEPRVTTGEKPSEPEPAASFQARLWKNLQLGSKGRSGGGRAPAERRTAEPLAPLPMTGGKGDLQPSSKWSGFKRRRQVLDRVFSSSQPNLCCSAAEPLEPAGESGSALRRLRAHLLPQGKGPPPGRRPEPAAGCEGPESGREGRRPGAHLSHQKSSSLPGTACLEQLLQGSPAAGRTQDQRTEDGDSSAVSAGPRRSPAYRAGWRGRAGGMVIPEEGREGGKGAEVRRRTATAECQPSSSSLAAEECPSPKRGTARVPPAFRVGALPSPSAPRRAVRRARVWAPRRQPRSCSAAGATSLRPSLHKPCRGKVSRWLELGIPHSHAFPQGPPPMSVRAVSAGVCS